MYKTQLINHQDSYNQLNRFMSLSDQTRVNKSLRSFNEEQIQEREFINELYFKFKQQQPIILPLQQQQQLHHQQLNSFPDGGTSGFTLLNTSPAGNKSAVYFTPQRVNTTDPMIQNTALGKSYDNLYATVGQYQQFNQTASTPVTTNSVTSSGKESSGGFVQNHLRSFLSSTRLTEPIRAAPSHNEVNNDEITTTPTTTRVASTLPTGAKLSKTFKVGYLLKRSHHSHVKNWLKRRCQSENGFFYIFHSDETKEPVKLNLVISNIKV
jgi:hypothetical protein